MDLSKLDPNLVAGIVTLLGTLATWALGKARGAKQADLSELLDDAITHEVEDALDDGETLDTIEDRLTSAALKLAGKAGVKLPPATVRVAVQWGVVEFRKRVKQRRLNDEAARDLPDKAADLAALARRIADKLATLTPDVAIDTITPAREAGTELLAIGPDGKLGPAQ